MRPRGGPALVLEAHRYGNEQWEFDEDGYMRRREASVNDVAIDETDRRLFGPRPGSERDAQLPLA